MLECAHGLWTAFHFVDAKPGLQLSAATYLLPTESWNKPNNNLGSLAACKKRCEDMRACVYGTYVTSGERKGQCWLSAHTHTGGKSPSCGVPCQSFTKVSGAPAKKPASTTQAPIAAPAMPPAGHVPAVTVKGVGHCNCDPAKHPSAFTSCMNSPLSNHVHVMHLAKRFHTLAIGEHDQHRCHMVGAQCKCCDCKADLGAIDIAKHIRETTGNYHQALPPYLVAGKPVQTLAECELMCSADKLCKYGTLLKSPNGGVGGTCYLAEHGLQDAQPCVTECHSFRKITIQDGFAKQAQAGRFYQATPQSAKSTKSESGA